MIPYYYGTDTEYAHRRLSGTFVLTTDKKLCYILSIAPAAKGVEILGEYVGSNTGADVVDVQTLDMTPLQLGYTYIPEHRTATFLSRVPARNINKQGLSTSALKSTHCDRRVLVGKHLLMPVFGAYPNLTEVLKKVKKEKIQSHPISRHFSVTLDNKLEYRGCLEVGEINEREQPVLYPKMAYLQQHLDSVVK